MLTIDKLRRLAPRNIRVVDLKKHDDGSFEVRAVRLDAFGNAVREMRAIAQTAIRTTQIVRSWGKA